jgi:hypothetical protein
VVSITFVISLTSSIGSVVTNHRTNYKSKGRPSFLAGVYELRDKFGTYKNARPSIETSKGTTPFFQTPHTRRSLCQETKEDLRIVGLF